MLYMIAAMLLLPVDDTFAKLISETLKPVGLIGALIVIRSGFSTYGWATILPLIFAVAYVLNMILLKKRPSRGLPLRFNVARRFMRRLGSSCSPSV
ncbi:hypothetical protein [Litoreibacter halocynthiae]|uniref:hypothetical protein n=1 Tax=Litoreibacter halocynthiae TaxID=1242689 RepID=UPI0024934B5A|nr:hypothetical protein [Litoreibacter halocynthiae]